MDARSINPPQRFALLRAPAKPGLSIVARAWPALALLAACGGGARGGATGGGASGTSGTSGTTSAPPGPPVPGLANRATPADASAPTAPVPPLPGGGERAYISDDRGLVEVSTAGGSQVLVPSAGWCNVDARANVVWFLDEGLHAFDLTDRRARRITRGPVGELEVIIDWGREQLGGESAILFDVGIALKLAGPGKPALEMVMGCDGDRMVYCYEEGLKKPVARVVELQRQAGTIQLVDPDYVASLAARGKRASLWSPPPVPPPVPRRKPVVDAKRCEDRSRCGALIAVPASPLWLVHTYNARGDYYHENRELWDPATGKYVHLAGDKLVWSKDAPPVPNHETDYRGMRVSPLGVLSYQGAVFDSARVYYAQRDPEHFGGLSCGWAGGGWRIDGPTDGFHH